MTYYDYAFKFASEADAIAAAEGTKLGSRDAQGNWNWSTDYVLPNIKAWRISQDTGTPPVHTYLTGYFYWVSVSKPNAQLTNHPNLQFALDRDGPPYVLKNNIGAIMQDISCEPIFAGSHYPIGGIN